MRIGIVGSGNVGGTLGRRFAEAGHQVTFGARRPESDEAKELARVPNARVASPREAAQSSEVVLLATPWPATAAALRGVGDLKGKILFDATNALTASSTLPRRTSPRPAARWWRNGRRARRS
jgi:predicted dinucleotide-binding enzyme